jgi:hypothetical protein
MSEIAGDSMVDRKSIWIAVVSFALGIAGGVLVATQDVVKDTEKPQSNTISSVVGSKTKTDIAYVPKTVVKGKKEKTDLQANIGKTDFVVKVNGEEQTFTKEDDERFIFDKNKLTLDQTSKVTLDVNVPTRDDTKRWAVGVGYGEDGMAYTLDFPVGKANNLGGWVYRDDDSTAVGVKMKF